MQWELFPLCWLGWKISPLYLTQTQLRVNRKGVTVLKLQNVNQQKKIILGVFFHWKFVF